MCSYCGCRAIGPIADLTAEHERIVNLMGEVRRSAQGGDHEDAVRALAELQKVLTLHDTVEELAVYPAMARRPEFEDKVAILFDEHDDVDDIVAAALATAGDSGPDTIDWTPVLDAFEHLFEHIDHEENGLFPAAAVALDPGEWDEAVEVRRRAQG